MCQLRPSLIKCLCLLGTLLVLVVEGKAGSARHYVLVHGAGHGAWCWFKVQQLLQRAGQNVTSFDLTSAGIDPVDANTVLTFEDYNKPLIDLLSALPENEKVVLVGHSAGGLSLTHAIHMFGTKKITVAVFAGAVMLRSGFITPEDIAILQGFRNKSKAGMTRLEILRQVLYNRSPEEDVMLASALLKPAPGHAILAARFNSTGVDVDEVPRVYVKTMMDRVFKQEVQDAMIKKWPPQKVIALNSDHCLFFSAPKKFAQVLLKV